MNRLAKRVHNLTPDPVRLTLAGGETLDLDVSSTEFFQESFQGEASDGETTYRMVSDGDDDPLLVARQTPDGWEVLGEVESVESAAEGGTDGAT
ncbi:hypothetical protein [Halomarina litorea]|uniref:hypothetical protein n=1 Tax=Halomarina litorea TaxID=2961595 RepID=UPI0020C57AF3|nr:hypothetical protein [Halomarina sp. BCD28]